MAKIDSEILKRMKPFRTVDDLKPLVTQLGRARIVMLGEATHGTHEFYDWRRRISQELIQNFGFNFIAVEGDWPPCQKINRYIQDIPDVIQGHDIGHDKIRDVKIHDAGISPRAVLQEFRRWPTWMWANTDVSLLVGWLRNHNEVLTLNHRPEKQKVGFYGLDVYSLFDSIDCILSELKKINPFLAKRAALRYGCFETFRRDEKKYIQSLLSFPEGCRNEVVKALEELLHLDPRQDSFFNIRQHARIISNAENYYRTMIFGDEDSWNVRDRHMMETLTVLMDHYGPEARGIVWEHNTHVGDYRATDMVKYGQVNLGGLARQHYGAKYGAEAVALVGFGTYEGTVIASRAWDGPIERLRVPPAKEGSYEAVFHDAAHSLGGNCFYSLFDTPVGPLSEVRGHRAIGVVYDPAHEGRGNYVPTSLANRYNAFLFIDHTEAVEPLILGYEEEDIPEAWPSGL